MKKLLLLVCLVVVAANVSAQNRRTGPSKAEITFEDTEHNFGTVPEKGKKVSHTFEFTNTGAHPLVITRISTTCRCVDYKFSKKPIPPGEKGEITVTYNPKKQTGVFYKVVQVFSNTEEERHLLTVRGEVIK